MPRTQFWLNGLLPVQSEVSKTQTGSRATGTATELSVFISFCVSLRCLFWDEHGYVRMFRLPDSVSGKADADG